MAAPSLEDELRRLRRERDLYFGLLNLGMQRELEPFLRGALALVVEVVHAHQGYLELHDEDDHGGRRSWSMAHGFSPDEIAGVQAAISQGIIAEALASGRTIETPSALLDPRFRDRGSVRLSRIEAVLCAPIGDPPLGVLYLQRREEPGPFPDAERQKIELFASYLAPLADRLLSAQRCQEQADSTREVRQSLRLNDVIGRSPAFAACLRQIALVAPLDVSVLLTGESGTGKSQLARVLHDNGPRRNGPFVEVNCATLQDTLLENELFGSMPGGHSTATKRIPGRLEAAERGTLLLDEIGDLTPLAQAKLLQLLQSKVYHPLASAKATQADFRLIAATNIDLQAAVRERRFREDLFYRLQVVSVHVPTLDERRDDIGELATFFCAAACERHRLRRLTLSRGALRALEAAPWPGNVRQLAHAVESAAIQANGEGALQVERQHLFPEPGVPGNGEAPRPTFQEATRRFQARLLRETMEDTGWNIVEGARRLDLARSHVYNLIRAFGLERERR